MLHRWHRDGSIDRVSLIASELVTNAIRHARTELALEIEAREGTIYLEVVDRGSGRPSFVGPNADGVGGLGLPIVEALARSWGTRERDGGKGVWAEVNG